MSVSLSCQKKYFQIPNDHTYLNIAGMSPLMNSVIDAGINGIKLKAHPWKIDDSIFNSAPDKARNLFAQLIHTDSADIAIIPSATYGVESALKNIKGQPGQNVIVQDDEFPSLILPIQRWAKKNSIQVITIPRPKDFDWTQAILSKINQQTALVAFSISHWTDGSLADPETICLKAKQVGACTIIDGCQSLGALDFNAKSCGVDFLVAPTYKWLMGPYSMGFLYVNPRFHNGQGLEEYWASRVGSDDFINLTKYIPDYKEGAYRFDMGERSQFINVPMATAALEQILSWSCSGITNYLKPLTDYLATEAIKKGYQVAPEKFRSQHFLGLKKDNTFNDSFKQTLASNNIHVSFRGEWLRIAPSVYNDKSDLDKLLQFI